LRVLFLTPRFSRDSGGDGLYAYELAHALATKDVEVSVLTLKDERFILRAIDTRVKEPNLDLGRIGRSSVSLNFYSASAAKALKAALQVTKPDVVHVHGIHQYFTYACAASLRSARVPTVFTVHDYKLLCGNAGFFSDRRTDVCLRCLHGNVLPAIVERCKARSLPKSFGAAIQMALWHFGGATSSFNVVHCGSSFVYDLVGQNRYVADRRKRIRFPRLLPDIIPDLDSGSCDLRIVYVGRFVPHKGVLIFAEAVRGLDAPVDVYGDGPLMNDVRVLLASQENVRLHGWTDREELKKGLRPGTIVVLPYLAHETFCFALVEAMSLGACVVATARGAIPEILRDGHNGVIVQSASSTDFRRKISELLGNPEEVLRLGRQAASDVRNLPGIGEHAEAIIKMYNELITGPEVITNGCR
jgi:glycosyltransferase involved in cell wall biosynthesis